MAVTVTIAGTSYSYPSTEDDDSWGGNATTVIEQICNNAIWTINVVDNVTSMDTDKPLSANQGKILNDAIDAIGNNILTSSALDDPPADDAETAPTSKWNYDNLYNPSYKSDWITLNSTTTVTHNLGIPFEDLDIKIIDNVVDQDVTNLKCFVVQGPPGTPSTVYGFSLQAIDNNSISINVGSGGNMYINSSGSFTSSTTTKFKIIVRKRIFK